MRRAKIAIAAITEICWPMTWKTSAPNRFIAGRRRIQTSGSKSGCSSVTVHARPFPAGGTEFTVQGTAVRARTAVRPAAPFTAHVSGQEFAGLLRAGWVPVALAIGICVGTRHDDRRRRSGLGNREMPGYTGLVSYTRGVARTRLMHAAMSQGADGVVVGEMTLRISERPCQTYERRPDRAAEVTVLGTSIVSFGRSPVTADRPPLTMMRLNPAAERRVSCRGLWPGGRA